jgi:hypothetical protein
MLFAILTSGCDNDKPVYSSLKAAKRKWEKKRSDDYSYRFQIKDLNGIDLDAKVSVQDGGVKEVLNPISGSPAVFTGDSIPALERMPTEFRTIDEWFDYIQAEFTDDASYVGYNREVGHPIAISRSKPGNDNISFYYLFDYNTD